MNGFGLIFVMLVASAADGHAPTRAYSSRELLAEQSLLCKIMDAGQTYITWLSSILHAYVENADEAGQLSPAQTDLIWKRVQAVRTNVAALMTWQGFPSAAGRATYDRRIDAIAMRTC